MDSVKYHKSDKVRSGRTVWTSADKVENIVIDADMAKVGLLVKHSEGSSP